MLVPCDHYSSKAFCTIYAVLTAVYGVVLVPICILQWVSERHHDRVGAVPKVMHRMFTVSSICFTIGWAFNVTVSNNVEAFISSVLIDLVTAGLVSTLWIVGYGILSSLYRASNLFFPFFPRLFFFTMTSITIVAIFAVNITSLILDRMWPRCFFYAWLAFTFASAILILWLLTSRLFHIVGEDRLFLLRRLRAVVCAATFLAFAGVAVQILDAIGAYKDKDLQFTAQAPDSSATFSLIFLNLQGLGMAVGTWYGWITMELCPKGEYHEAPQLMDSGLDESSIQSTGRAAQ